MTQLEMRIFIAAEEVLGTGSLISDALPEYFDGPSDDLLY